MNNYLLVNATNEGGIWEADISRSTNGFRSDSQQFHLILGQHPNCADPRQISVGEILTMVGWAIQDQITDDDSTIRGHAYGARNLIRDAAEDTEFVVTINAGSITKDAAVQRLTYAADHPRSIRQLAA